MMKANELRIGNYVSDSGNKTLRIDRWENPSMIAQKIFFEDMEVHPLTEFVDRLTPIPLTEEWLLKFGFVKKKMDSEYWFRKIINKKFIFLTNDIGPNGYSNKLEFVYAELRDFGNELVRVKFVHQLQNLYFALTGEELNLNQ